MIGQKSYKMPNFRKTYKDWVSTMSIKVFNIYLRFNLIIDWKYMILERIIEITGIMIYNANK